MNKLINLISKEVKNNKKSVRMSKPAWELVKTLISKLKIVLTNQDEKDWSKIIKEETEAVNKVTKIIDESQ